MSKTYSERFKEISEKEACFEEAFVLLFEAIDEILGKGRVYTPKNIKVAPEDISDEIIITTGGTA